MSLIERKAGTIAVIAMISLLGCKNTKEPTDPTDAWRPPPKLLPFEIHTCSTLINND